MQYLAQVSQPRGRHFYQKCHISNPGGTILGNLWIKRRKLFNKLWTALIKIWSQNCVMVNLWDTYLPKCIWQHPFPLFSLVSCITYKVDNHGTCDDEKEDGIRSTDKQIQKACVLKIPSYIFWRIFIFICSNLAKWFIPTQNFELGVPVRNYCWEHYFQTTF